MDAIESKCDRDRIINIRRLIIQLVQRGHKVNINYVKSKSGNARHDAAHNAANATAKLILGSNIPSS